MVKDLQNFLAKVEADKALQEKMTGIIKESTPDNVFANCNAVAAEMGYTITQDDMQAYADEHKEDLNDEQLDKVAGGIVVEVTCVLSYLGLTALSITSAVKNSKE